MQMFGRCLLRQFLVVECKQRVASRSFLFSKKKTYDRKVIAMLQSEFEISPKAFMKWKKKKELKERMADHEFIAERHSILGPDLATAHFIIARGGAAKFVDIDRWYKMSPGDKVVPLPNKQDDRFKLEGIDASNMELFYHSFDNFVNLELRYLNVSGCKNIDDWCLDRFVQFKDTVEMLDISDCPLVSERGLACLHKLTKLRVLHAHSMIGVKHAPLVSIMLEEAMPECHVQGLADGDASSMESVEEELPKFLQQFQEHALKEDKEAT